MLYVYGFFLNRYLYIRVNCIFMCEFGLLNLYMEKYFYKIFFLVFENLLLVLIGYCIFRFLYFFFVVLNEFYLCLL